MVFKVGIKNLSLRIWLGFEVPSDFTSLVPNSNVFQQKSAQLLKKVLTTQYLADINASKTLQILNACLTRELHY